MYKLLQKIRSPNGKKINRELQNDIGNLESKIQGRNIRINIIPGIFRQGFSR